MTLYPILLVRRGWENTHRHTDTHTHTHNIYIYIYILYIWTSRKSCCSNAFWVISLIHVFTTVIHVRSNILELARTYMHEKPLISSLLFFFPFRSSSSSSSSSSFFFLFIHLIFLSLPWSLSLSLSFFSIFLLLITSHSLVSYALSFFYSVFVLLQTFASDSDTPSLSSFETLFTQGLTFCQRNRQSSVLLGTPNFSNVGVTSTYRSQIKHFSQHVFVPHIRYRQQLRWTKLTYFFQPICWPSISYVAYYTQLWIFWLLAHNKKKKKKRKKKEYIYIARYIFFDGRK